VPEAWVINASPIILYDRVGRLDVIERLAPKIFVPSKVVEEIRDGISKDMSARLAVDWATRYIMADIQVPPSVEHWDIGPGESQVISHCLQGSGMYVGDELIRQSLEAIGEED